MIKIIKMIPCECLCGTLIPEFDKWGRKKRFVKGHHNRGKVHSEKSKQLMSENRIGKCCGEKNPNYGKHHSPETKQLMSENRPDYNGENNPNYGKCGKLSPNWKGGIAYEPYCQEWTPWLKKEIKDRDNHQCQNPDCANEITKNNSLCTHHINYQKKDCSTSNLITLCRSCNSKANSNREYWEEFYKNMIRRGNE